MHIRPDMQQKVGDKDYAMLVRGEDKHRNFIHVPAPTTDFSHEALALYDEIRHAQGQVMMKGADGKTEMDS